MRGLNKRAVGILTFVAGLVMIVIAGLTGEMEFALFLIFPVIYGGGITAVAGVLLVFAGMILLFLSILPVAPREAEVGGDRRVRGGGVILIGPVPIVFGSDWNMAILAILLTLVLVVVVFLLFF